MRKEIIRGCEARGDQDSTYLTRYHLLSIDGIHICLHIFHRSDADDLHDHPWPFVSLILWGGYMEESASMFAADRDRRDEGGFNRMVDWERENSLTTREFIRPGRLIYRRADHAHRVELVNGRKAVTLVFMGRKERNWGFFTARGWQHFREYFARKGC